MAPTAIHNGSGRGSTVRDALFNFSQILEGFQYGLTGGRCIETDGLEQMRQEPTDPSIAPGLLLIVHVFWRANDGVYLAHGRFQLLAFKRLEDC